MIHSILTIFQTNFPKEFTVNLNQDDFWTNFLLILNIIVSILAATFLTIWTDKKTKDNENRSFIEKIKAEKTLNFCLNATKIFKTICSKNPNDISKSDIKNLNDLVTSEELILISKKSEDDIKNFRDYIIEVKENPIKKDFKEEKNYLNQIKEIVNNIQKK